MLESAAFCWVEVCVMVVTVLTGTTTTEGVTVTVMVAWSRISAVVVGARPMKDVVVAAMKLVTYTVVSSVGAAMFKHEQAFARVAFSKVDRDSSPAETQAAVMAWRF